MNLKDVSEWTIFIDDVEGELAMEKREEATGRTIDVLAKEEIIPIVESLEEKLEIALDALYGAKMSSPFGSCAWIELEIAIKKIEAVK